MKAARFLFAVALVAIFVLSACAPEVITEKVIETQIVEVVKTEVVEKTVIETQIVEVEVEKEGSLTMGYAAPALYGGQKMIEDNFGLYANAKGWGILTTNANADPQKQNNDIDYLLSSGVAAIVTVPEDSAGICTAVEKAKAAGVPFFTIDRSPAGCAIDMTVLSDNRLAGQQAGQQMVDELTAKYGEAKGKVLEITGNLGQNVGQLRRDGFHDIVDKYPNIEVIQKVGDWDAAKGQQIALDVLTSDPDVDGIYFHSDNVYGPGTVAALEQLGLFAKRGDPKHIFMTSVDCGPWALGAIWDGIHDGCGSQPVSDFGIVVDWIEIVLNGGTIEEGDVVVEGAIWSPAKIIKNADGTMELFLATTLVNKDNITDPAIWTNMDKNGAPPADRPAFEN
jgi:ABC-type sugar transport system substrate-binding protein